MTQFDLYLQRDQLKGRTFLLGNRRAFSLSLPASSGSVSATLHPHKWFGAYLYGRKFLEGQVVRLPEHGRSLLSWRQQIGLAVGLTSVRRDYVVDGAAWSERFFVPDGLQAIACALSGDTFEVEPEFDMRFYRHLNRDVSTYSVERIADGAIVSSAMPTGRYDDETERFIPDSNGGEGPPLYAAVQVFGDDVWAELLPERFRTHRKVFRKDRRRRMLLAEVAGESEADHAPLWTESSSAVYAPVRLHIHGRGTVIYGFGASREEALSQVRALRDNLTSLEAEKTEEVKRLIEHAPLTTSDVRVDTAYVHVLCRLLDALVARNASADDTALDAPATMILAGNQYFHDAWKRDENIALGFLLTLGFYDLARDVINDTWRLQDERTGRLPQRIRAGEEPPYHSSDGTLWALWRLYEYWRCTGDESLLADKLPMARLFFERSLERSVHGLLPSGRTTTPHYLWETWMDTPHTPRDGFPVEIQMLWIACLSAFRELFASTHPELEARMAAVELEARQGLERFNVRGVPADSLDGEQRVRDLITPNPYFCFGVGLDLGVEMERAMREVGKRQLAGRQGILTLAPSDWGSVFPPELLVDRRLVRGRRMRSIGKLNYHRGVEWNWLAQFFVKAELKYGEPDVAYRRYLRAQVRAALDTGGIGGISELFDLGGDRGPEFQAWSMSGFLESLHAFAGVRVDVPAGRIAVEPQLPDSWPEIRVRKWYGRVPFDVTYRRIRAEHAVEIAFPRGETTAAIIDLNLTVPPFHDVGSVELWLDGVPAVPNVSIVDLTGANRRGVRLTMPATGEMKVVLRTRRSTDRTVRSA